MAESAEQNPVELSPFAAHVIAWMDANKISGREMARRTGLSPSYFTTLRSGKTAVPSFRIIDAISKEMKENLYQYLEGTSLATPAVANIAARIIAEGETDVEVIRSRILAESNVAQAPNEALREFERGPLARDVPEIGVSVGGEDHDFSFNGSVERFVERPRGLAQARKAFALIVVGDSMAPAYEEHTNIFINPAKPPAINDYVVVEFFDEQEFVDDVSYPAGKALLKRLVARTPEYYVLKQYNPLLEFKIERKRVKQLWRVVPPNELLGFS